MPFKWVNLCRYNAAKRMFAEDQSDHLTTLNAYNAWMDARSMGRAAEMAFTRDNFLSFRTLAGAVHVDSP